MGAREGADVDNYLGQGFEPLNPPGKTPRSLKMLNHAEIDDRSDF